VDVPGHDEDGALGLLDSLGKGGEVGGGVNEERGARRRRNAPAVASGHSDLMVGCERHPSGVTHTLPFPVARARTDALPRVPRHSLLTCFSPTASCMAYPIESARLRNDALCKRQGQQILCHGYLLRDWAHPAGRGMGGP